MMTAIIAAAAFMTFFFGVLIPVGSILEGMRNPMKSAIETKQTVIGSLFIASLLFSVVVALLLER